MSKNENPKDKDEEKKRITIYSDAPLSDEVVEVVKKLSNVLEDIIKTPSEPEPLEEMNTMRECLSFLAERTSKISESLKAFQKATYDFLDNNSDENATISNIIDYLQATDVAKANLEGVYEIIDQLSIGLKTLFMNTIQGYPTTYGELLDKEYDL